MRLPENTPNNTGLEISEGIGIQRYKTAVYRQRRNYWKIENSLSGMFMFCLYIYKIFIYVQNFSEMNLGKKWSKPRDRTFFIFDFSFRNMGKLVEAELFVV